MKKFYPPESKRFCPGEIWNTISIPNRQVKIMKVERFGPEISDVEIYYQDISTGKELQKDAWNFQIRYEHVMDTLGPKKYRAG